MLYRMSFKVETDEPGILAARELVMRTLEPMFGWVASVTVEEWMFQASSRPASVSGARSFVEHSGARRGGRRL